MSSKLLVNHRCFYICYSDCLQVFLPILSINATSSQKVYTSVHTLGLVFRVMLIKMPFKVQITDVLTSSALHCVHQSFARNHFLLQKSHPIHYKSRLSLSNKSFQFISLNMNVENAVANTTMTTSSTRRKVLLPVFYLQQNAPKRNCQCKRN